MFYVDVCLLSAYCQDSKKTPYVLFLGGTFVVWLSFIFFYIEISFTDGGIMAQSSWRPAGVIFIGGFESKC